MLCFVVSETDTVLITNLNYEENRVFIFWTLVQ